MLYKENIMKNILLFTIIANLFACSFGGFKPPRQTEHWMLPGNVINKIGYEKYLEKEQKDMRDCDIDSVAGYHTSVEQGLCMEAKGWYWTAGPICNTLGFVDKPICVKWRIERGLPYPTPEEIRRI